MIQEYPVEIDGNAYMVVVSDEKEALLAAKAAGKASVGLWNREHGTDLSVVQYVVESLDVLNQEYLKQILQRNLGLPWVIAETDRLLIREFQMGDEKLIPEEPEDTWEDKAFRIPEVMREYIRYQYGFYGYGVWAVIEKESGKLAGEAGIANLVWESDGREHGWGRTKSDALEMGYHIFTPYRHKGYGEEACGAILDWCRQRMECPIYAKIDAMNEASIRLIEKLGFRFIDQRYSESGQWQCLYEWNY